MPFSLQVTVPVPPWNSFSVRLAVASFRVPSAFAKDGAVPARRVFNPALAPTGKYRLPLAEPSTDSTSGTKSGSVGSFNMVAVMGPVPRAGI